MATMLVALKRHETLIRRLSQWLVYAMLVIPLVVGNSYFFPFIVPKYLAFRSLVEVLVLGYLLLLSINATRYRPKWTLASVGVIAYAASAVLSGLFGVDWHSSLWGTYERMESIFTTLHYVALFLILPTIFTRAEFTKALKWSVWVSVLLCIYGLAQRSGAEWTVEANRDRISATIGNPAYVGAYLLFQMGFAVYIFLQEKQAAWKWVWPAVLALQVVTFVFTLTRGAMLGLMAALPVVMGLWLWSTARSRLGAGGYTARIARSRKVVAALLVAMIVLPVTLVLLRNTNFVKSVPLLQRFADISPQASTAKTRFWTWNSAWQGILERPVLGWGPEQFPVPFNKYINPLHYKGPNSETWFDHAHNIVLDIWETQGAVGLLAWLAFIAGLIWLAWQKLQQPAIRSLGLVAIGILVAYLIQNLFLFDVLVVWMMLALLGALLQSRGEEPSPALGELRTAAPVKVPLFPALVYGLFLVFWLLPLNARAAAVSKGVIVAKQVDGNPDVALQMKWYQDNIFNKPLRTGAQEVPRQLAASVLTHLQQGHFQDQPEVRRQAAAYTRQVLEEAWRRYPYDLQTPISLAKVIALNAEVENSPEGIQEAITVIKEARKHSPQRVELINDLGLYQMAAGLVEEAITTYQYMAQITEYTPYARWNLGFAYLSAGRKEEAKAEIEAALVDPDFKGQVFSSVSMLRRLSNLYIALEDWEKLAEVYRQVVVLEPNNPQNWGALALTYQKLGEYAIGIAAAEEAARVDPQYREAADELIRQLRASSTAQ